MPHLHTGNRDTASAPGAALLTIGGIAAAFAAAACCALPIMLASLGIGAAWLGGIASVTAPHRDLLLGLGILGVVGGAILLFRMQCAAAICGPAGVCAPRWLRALLLLGLVAGATLLWLGYSYA